MTAPAVTAPPVARRRWFVAPALWGTIAIVALALAGWIGYSNLKRGLADLRAQWGAAREDIVAEATRATRVAREVQSRVDDLARDLEQVKDQRAALDQLYLELARGRDEATLLDVERLITLAAQDLRFTGHVAGALNALQAADARLARMDRPQYVGLRRALGRDIEKLRAVPVVDVTGIALKLDQVAASVDALPLLSDPAAKPARAAVPPPSPPTRPESIWDKVRAWLADEFGDLVRIREIETPDSLLLSGLQQQLVRSQFRLRLLDARQALLARNERVFRADLAEAQSLLTRYFDVKSANGGAMLLQLRQLAQSTLSVDVPTLDESLAAIRATRPAAAAVPAR
ncbi:MAG TPA: uroporphyrinogen-III C-methyltransferase [Burkholderiaceae bacterium]|nr:uroporphyrinogen-III C-methyltransferase [Burkholderiaceae bacterium]